ncbi:hypothetical protein PVAG01_08740 [Phlyctema vagabunda]|uniref:Uncharacterized protein n=1 Tax=Phlyctema vagabunda TaxID=108571 RepID=A0ABR4PA89_9HELO
MDLSDFKQMMTSDLMPSYRSLGYLMLLTHLKTVNAERAAGRRMFKQSPQTCTLNKLPGELRRQIFIYAMDDDLDTEGLDTPPIIIALRAEQMLYHEILEIYGWRKSMFVAPIRSFPPFSTLSREAMGCIRSMTIDLQPCEREITMAEGIFRSAVFYGTRPWMERTIGTGTAPLVEAIGLTRVCKLSIEECATTAELSMWLSCFANLTELKLGPGCFVSCRRIKRDYWAKHGWEEKMDRALEKLSAVFGTPARLDMVYGCDKDELPLSAYSTRDLGELIKHCEVWRWGAEDGKVLGCANQYKRLVGAFPEQRYN